MPPGMGWKFIPFIVSAGGMVVKASRGAEKALPPRKKRGKRAPVQAPGGWKAERRKPPGKGACGARHAIAARVVCTLATAIALAAVGAARGSLVLGAGILREEGEREEFVAHVRRESSFSRFLLKRGDSRVNVQDERIGMGPALGFCIIDAGKDGAQQRPSPGGGAQRV